MAERVSIRLVGGDKSQWYPLPGDWDFKRLEHVPADGWVPVGDGRWCRASAIIEARVVVDDESEERLTPA
jgi:hypothetical protein